MSSGETHPGAPSAPVPPAPLQEARWHVCPTCFLVGFTRNDKPAGCRGFNHPHEKTQMLPMENERAARTEANRMRDGVAPPAPPTTKKRGKA